MCNILFEKLDSSFPCLVAGDFISFFKKSFYHPTEFAMTCLWWGKFPRRPTTHFIKKHQAPLLLRVYKETYESYKNFKKFSLKYKCRSKYMIWKTRKPKLCKIKKWKKCILIKGWFQLTTLVCSKAFYHFEPTTSGNFLFHQSIPLIVVIGFLKYCCNPEITTISETLYW